MNGYRACFNPSLPLSLPQIITMSWAFMREGEDQWLSDVSPSVQALIVFLTKENNGVRVYEKRNTQDASGRSIHEMSNGLSYARDTNGKWEIASLPT